ncbi:hypothetical protein BDY24DRAFT_415975 [Mrakia frigida]|uniref:alpha/beta hydrolase family protein n=1 Tax=Mrakia frigida TaxID=29902 RepID=UPI003FCC213D
MSQLLHHLFPRTANPSTYPLILLGHGTVDSAIHYTESIKVAEWLKGKGFEHELVLIEGGEHGFDSDPCDGELEKQVKDFRAKAWRFLEEKIGRK